MEKLKLDDFTRYKFISGLKFSPGGKRLAFILHQMDVEENKYLSNIHIYDLEKKILPGLHPAIQQVALYLKMKIPCCLLTAGTKRIRKERKKGRI